MVSMVIMVMMEKEREKENMYIKVIILHLKKRIYGLIIHLLTKKYKKNNAKYTYIYIIYIFIFLLFFCRIFKKIITMHIYI